MPLEVSVTGKEGGTYTISAQGSIDSSTYSILENQVEAVLAPCAKVIIFDMEGVSYISSMGVGVILKAKKYMEENGGNIILIKLAPQVKMVFDIIKALPEQTIFTSMEEADAYLAAIQRSEINKRKPAI